MKVSVLVGFNLPEECDPKARVAEAKVYLTERTDEAARQVHGSRPKLRWAKKPNQAEIELRLDVEDVRLAAFRVTDPPYWRVLCEALKVEPADLHYVEIAKLDP